MATATLREVERDGLRLLVDENADARGVLVAFTGRTGGSSEPPFDTLNLSARVGDDRAAANKARVARALGFETDRLAQTRQVHGARVIEVAPGEAGVRGEGDGLVTRVPGAVLGVLTADCVPVLLEGERGIAALHAGWRGLVAGILEAGIAEVAPVWAAWVGPSIHACCYEVGDEVTSRFERAGLPVADDRRVDPAAAACAALKRAGVTNIAASERCTSCDGSYFSYRRDGRTGRQGGFIALLGDT